MHLGPFSLIEHTKKVVSTIKKEHKKVLRKNLGKFTTSATKRAIPALFVAERVLHKKFVVVFLDANSMHTVRVL